MEGWLSSLSDNFKNRFRDPFLGTFLVVWLVHNAEFLFWLFSFEDGFELDVKLNRLFGYFKENPFGWNLLQDVGWTFLVLISTFFLKGIGLILKELYEEKAVKEIQVLLKSSKVVAKTKYDRLEQERDQLEERYEKTRKEKIEAQGEHSKMETEFISLTNDLKKTESKFVHLDNRNKELYDELGTLRKETEKEYKNLESQFKKINDLLEKERENSSNLRDELIKIQEDIKPKSELELKEIVRALLSSTRVNGYLKLIFEAGKLHQKTEQADQLVKDKILVERKGKLGMYLYELTNYGKAIKMEVNKFLSDIDNQFYELGYSLDFFKDVLIEKSFYFDNYYVAEIKFLESKGVIILKSKSHGGDDLYHITYLGVMLLQRHNIS